jgi:addiction module RelB/DinJ family antitoxin
MSYDATVTVRTKSETKIKAQEYLDSIGINLTSAVNLFLSDIAYNHRLSFDFAPSQLVSVPDEEVPQEVLESLKQMQEADPSTFIRIDPSNESELLEHFPKVEEVHSR